MLLLDASVWVAAKDADDQYFESARALVTDAMRPVASLDLTLYESANVVVGRWRQPEAARDLCRTIVVRCEDRLVSVDRDLVEQTIEIAAENDLTAYDAAYVAAARRHGWTLVSTDIADLVAKGLAVAPDVAVYP